MKKLLVTAIGAAAAFGAVAGTISTQRFESVTGELPLARTTSELDTLAGGNYWSGDDLTNTYTVVSADGEKFPQDKPLGTPTKALAVKTVFGNPLKLDAIAGGTSTNIPASGIYFDSLVKFTVCEDEPDCEYDGAKIVMWLQEKYVGDTDTVAGTNIMVRANYINADGTFTTTDFTCYKFDDNIDDWHRVTIKTWADITNGSGIPGFAIFIDGTIVNVASGTTMADAFVGNLTEAAGYTDFGPTAVFASLVQGNAAGKSTITSASFDGTGTLTDLVFTDEAPFDAAEDYVAPEVAVTIDGVSDPTIKTLAQAISAVNDATESATLQLKKGMTLDGTLAFESSVNVVLDFAGIILTNTSAEAAISNGGLLTITNSTVEVGGVYCSAAGKALVQGGEGELVIYGGMFNGDVDLEEAVSVEIFGGSYNDDVAIAVFLAGDKKVSTQGATYPGLYDVIDKVSYTVKFISGEGSCTNEYTQLEGTTVAVPTAQEIVGKTFSAWSPAIAGETVTFEADATYTAVYTVNTYTVTFVDANGEGGTVNDVAYGTVLSTIAPQIGSLAGYTAAWDTSLDGTVTDNITVTAVYTGKSYTVNTYTNNALYATYSSTYAGSDPVLADPIVGEGQSWDSKWYTENGGETEFSFNPDAEGEQNAYATITSSGPVVPDIPEGESTVEVAGDGSEDAATVAASVNVTKPAAASDVADETYQGYFSKSAEYNSTSGKWEVTAEFTEKVKGDAATTAEAIVSGSAESGDVTIPAGLFYRITTMGALDDANPTVDAPSTPSTGKVTVSKPGDGTKGFIKVELGTTAF